MDAYLSYDHADRATAEGLAHELRSGGVSVWFDADQLKAGDDWAGTLERELRESRNLLVLVGTGADQSTWQRREWRKILEEVWRDPGKRLVPVLLPGASMPAFVRSTSSSGELQAVRIDDPADTAGAAQAILQVMQGTREASLEASPGSGGSHRTRGTFGAARGLALEAAERGARSADAENDADSAPFDPRVKVGKGIPDDSSGRDPGSSIVAVPAAADREKLAARYAKIEEFARSLKR
jgi:hypothetical protein